MGQTLSEPVVEKISSAGEDKRLYYGLSEMQGWRISMEDAHTTILDLVPSDSAAAKNHASQISFFGVYDGHGGERVANFTGDKLYNIVTNQSAFKEKDYVKALKDGFLATDRAILNDPKYEDEVSGCTACVTLLTDDKIYCANAGDSRAVLGVKGRAKPLSFDHKPQNDEEKARITAAGGFVDFGRVNGNLALSRAIGDFEFKKSADLPPEKQIVTALPQVTVHEQGDSDEFVVVACDGIWDCQSSQAVVEFVRRGIAAKQPLEKICENMMDNCLASNSETGGVGCDNMTMVVVALLKGRTKEQWYDEIAKRVSEGDGPCAPPEYAEFRGPGVHHNFDDSEDGYDGDSDGKKSFGTGGYRGRIIFLGDGTEVLTDSDDTEMFDSAADEDKDLASQVERPHAIEQGKDSSEGTAKPAEKTKSETETESGSKSDKEPVAGSRDAPEKLSTETTTAAHDTVSKATEATTTQSSTEKTPNASTSQADAPKAQDDKKTA